MDVLAFKTDSEILDGFHQKHQFQPNQVEVTLNNYKLKWPPQIISRVHNSWKLKHVVWVSHSCNNLHCCIMGNDSDYSELLGFRTLSIVLYSKNYTIVKTL
jgi:hypothetical protein